MDIEEKYVTDYIDDDDDVDDSDLIDIYKVEPHVTYLYEDLDNLPGNLKIFTLPVTTSLHKSKFDLYAIYKFFPLSYTDIVTVQTDANIRTLRPTKKAMVKTDDIGNFMHQITLVMSIYTDHTKNSRKDVNIKLFNNNAIQMTGLMSIYQCNFAINKLIYLLRGEKGFIFKKGTNVLSKLGEPDTEFRTLRFINLNLDEDDESELWDVNDIWITPVRISTINTIYHYRTKVNRMKLYFKMQELKLQKKFNTNINISFQSDTTAPVKISYPMKDGKIVVIFVFESGKISLLACKHREHVICAFKFIQSTLENNHEDIIIKDIMDVIANNPEIRELIDMDALARTL